jgi:hypothetical protein
VTDWFKAHERIQACKVYNQIRQAAAVQPEPRAAVVPENLSYSGLGTLTRAMFDSKMRTAGFRANEYVMSRGYEHFRKLHHDKEVHCWWPAATNLDHDQIVTDSTAAASSAIVQCEPAGEAAVPVDHAGAVH